jgi:phospholipid/cholesterol/gamma-HCH transport system substrate-binding protein
MKFKMRYADQLVGFFIIVALLSLIFVIFMLGRTQRWFSKNYAYKTYAVSASGLSKNMPVSYKGFSIGNVKSIQLTDDNRVEVIFTIQDKYQDRVTEGSLTEILVSPVGLGNQFIFYSGLGHRVLDEGELVPMFNSKEGEAYIARGIGYIPPHEDSIAVLMGNAQAVLDKLEITLDMVNAAMVGDEVTALGQTVGNINQITEDVKQITADIRRGISSPDGIMKIISGEGDAVAALEASFVSLAGTLDHIEKATGYLPREMPQIMQAITEARTALQAANDVLIALRNNPILRGGIPEHAEIDSSGTNPRNIRF